MCLKPPRKVGHWGGVPYIYIYILCIYIYAYTYIETRSPDCQGYLGFGEVAANKISKQPSHSVTSERNATGLTSRKASARAKATNSKVPLSTSSKGDFGLL